MEEKFSFNCTARGFNQNHEGAITQSDYAIRLRVRDNSRQRRRVTTSSVFFFQAKIRDASGFDRNDGQERKIEILRQFIGQRHLSYSLYNPLTGGGILLAHNPRSAVEYLTKWSDFYGGLDNGLDRR
ncbi:hypothetical protein R1538_25070 [Rhizobium leguminosarum]|uniref:hypothetical protein n=1 Tax=Rhizobium leguminosarum TaxID=384 RepID=UPI00293DB9D3|nr:hypothetical protein [Rhizobium leguminosarum]MDV4164387.1 hypothetical protein [Rhizobium leguminosarum]MDV4174673.1 hypothetical protein [Rhizobium leguminosarum]